MSVENYRKCTQVEAFLIRVLNPAPKTRRKLKGYYESLVYYEEGKMKMYPSQYRKHYQSFLKLFERAIDKLTTAKNQMQAERIKRSLPYLESSDDVWNLYQQVEKL